MNKNLAMFLVVRFGSLFLGFTCTKPDKIQKVVMRAHTANQ